MNIECLLSVEGSKKALVDWRFHAEIIIITIGYWSESLCVCVCGCVPCFCTITQKVIDLGT